VSGPKPVPAYDRVMARAVLQGECLVDTAEPNAKGYCRVGVTVSPGRYSTAYSHRVVWEHHHGPLPEGKCVLHHCDNPPCVKIEHLFLGTKADNNRDMTSKGRHWNQKKTHCPKGHEYTEENVRTTTTGGRQCKRCYR
jgi:hypothetical protein